MNDITNELKELNKKLELLIKKQEKEMWELEIGKRLIKSIIEEDDKNER